MPNPLPQLVAGVDDDIRIRESIEDLVASAGYSSALFSSGEEFLQSDRIAEVRCLITDVRMPGMNGIELQRRLKLERPQLPIIFISGHYDEEIRRAALEAGAFAFIYKPFDPDALLATVSRALTGDARG